VTSEEIQRAVEIARLCVANVARGVGAPHAEAVAEVGPLCDALVALSERTVAPADLAEIAARAAQMQAIGYKGDARAFIHEDVPALLTAVTLARAEAAEQRALVDRYRGVAQLAAENGEVLAAAAEGQRARADRAEAIAKAERAYRVASGTLGHAIWSNDATGDDVDEAPLKVASREAREALIALGVEP
jgi:hypothetical protein